MGKIFLGEYEGKNGRGEYIFRNVKSSEKIEVISFENETMIIAIRECLTLNQVAGLVRSCITSESNLCSLAQSTIFGKIKDDVSIKNIILEFNGMNVTINSEDTLDDISRKLYNSYDINIKKIV